MWSNVAKHCEKLVRKPNPKSSAIVRIKQSVGEGRQVPRFGVDGGGGVPAVGQFQKVYKRPGKAGNGARVSHNQEEFAMGVEKQKSMIMAAGKRIPLISFPNRRAGETQGTKAVVGRGQSHAMPSLPSGKASNHAPRTKLSDAEIEVVLLGAVLEESNEKKPASKKK